MRAFMRPSTLKTPEGLRGSCRGDRKCADKSQGDSRVVNYKRQIKPSEMEDERVRKWTKAD